MNQQVAHRHSLRVVSRRLTADTYREPMKRLGRLASQAKPSASERPAKQVIGQELRSNLARLMSTGCIDPLIMVRDSGLQLAWLLDDGGLISLVSPGVVFVSALAKELLIDFPCLSESSFTV